jgi:hypothetical protein
VSASQSTHTGVQPAQTTAWALAVNVKLGRQHLALHLEGAQRQHQAGGAAVDRHEMASRHRRRDRGLELGHRLAVRQLPDAQMARKRRQHRLEIGKGGRSDRQTPNCGFHFGRLLGFRHDPTS